MVFEKLALGTAFCKKHKEQWTSTKDDKDVFRHYF